MGTRNRAEGDNRHLVADKEVTISTVIGNITDGGVYQMTANERTVRVSTDGATAAFTLELPPVGEAAYKIYTIEMTDHTTDDVLVKSHHGAQNIADTVDGDLGIALTATLSAANMKMVLYSDGRSWFHLTSHSSVTGGGSAVAPAIA